MSHTIRISVNLRNPGEFLACCGLLEVAHRTRTTGQPPVGYFKESQFNLSGSEHSIIELLSRLVSEAPLLAESDGSSDAIAPLALPTLGLRLDWWRQSGDSKEPWRKTAFKLWAGQQTSMTVWAALRDSTRVLIDNDAIASDRPLSCRAMLTGRFGFDPGAAWNALDAGFSPNEQGYDVASAPIAELLAAVGIQRVRPMPTDDRDEFEYVAWTTPLAANVVPAGACGCIPDPHAKRFRFRITSRGSYGCFTTATEIRRSI